MEKIIAGRKKGSGIGVGVDVKGPQDHKVGELLRDLEPEDLLKFGLIPEFIGRLPVVATLGDLDEAALGEILSAPKNALLKQYARLFEMEDVKLTFDNEALHAVAKKAIVRKTGARGLRSIMESVLLDTMYDLPSREDVEEVIINKEVIDSKADPVVIVKVEEPKRKEGAR